MTAGYQKLFHENPKIGFLSHAKVFQRALDEGKVLAPAKNVAQMKQIIFNDYIDAALWDFYDSCNRCVNFSTSNLDTSIKK